MIVSIYQNRRIVKAHGVPEFFYLTVRLYAFFIASSTATATATVAPTIGLLPMPISPIISTDVKESMRCILH